MSQTKHRPPPLNIQRFKGNLVTQRHKQDAVEQQGNFLLKFIMNLGQPNPENPDNNTKAPNEVNNCRGLRRNIQKSKMKEDRARSSRQTIQFRKSEPKSPQFMTPVVAQRQTAKFNTQIIQNTAVFCQGKNNKSLRKDSLDLPEESKPTLKKQKAISFRKSESEQNQMLGKEESKDQKNKIMWIGSTKFDESIQVSQQLNESRPKTNEEFDINQKLITRNHADDIPDILPIDSDIKLNQSRKLQNLQSSIQKTVRSSKNINEGKFNKNIQNQSVHNFITEKKKPNQHINVGPTQDDGDHNRMSKIQQSIMSPMIRVFRLNTHENTPDNFALKLLQTFQTPEQKQKKINEAQSVQQSDFEYQKSANSILKLVANLGSKKSDEKLQRLKNVMKNQKNLKLKDYLRLTSLSNDSKFDRYSKSLAKNQKKSTKNNLLELKQNDVIENKMRKSYIFNKNKTAIDPTKSISLIKASLHKKLEKLIESALKVFQQIQQNKELIENEYEDLVFMCNFHKVFDQNLFKAADLLEDLLKQYEDKCEINQVIENKVQLTQSKIIEMMSPKKKKKKTEQFNMDLINKILQGFNIIKTEDAGKDQIKQK